MCRTIISDCSCASLLQDCHVLTFSSTGSVSDHLVLHPQLATGNFIIKAIWLPGSQTELAIITADFVKARSNKTLFLIYLASLLLNEHIFDFVILFVLLAVCEMNIVELVILIPICFFLFICCFFLKKKQQIYDLSVDALSPMYYFLLPSSKIRDATFLFNEEGKSVIAIMSSAGYMYTQLMDESSSAQHGPFYVTNVLEITHEDLKVSINTPYSVLVKHFCSSCLKRHKSQVLLFLCNSRTATGR